VETIEEMNPQVSEDQEILPQLIGEFHPIDAWQRHVNDIFYALRGSRLREYYQTFASADYRLAYALAEDYYRRLRRREQSRRTTPVSDSTSQEIIPQAHGAPLIVMEWGGGNGNLAACFLDRLQALDQEGAFYPRVQYVLIDRVESLLAEAKSNPGLVPHEGHVTIVWGDVEEVQGFAYGSVDRILCNELWSELPTKLMLRKEGDLQEEYVRPNMSEKRLEDIADWPGFVKAFGSKDKEALNGFPDCLDDVIWERGFRKVEAKDLLFRRMVTEFLKGLDEEVLVPVNLGACKTIQEAKRLLSPDAIGLSSFDAGTIDRDVLNDREKPCYSIHGGQFSFLVNLALLQRIARHAGMEAVTVEPQKEFVGRSLNANVMSLMDVLATHPNIQQADSWEMDRLILQTLGVVNRAYQSPYQRGMDYPLPDHIPLDQRDALESLRQSLKPDGVPDTVAYLTEEEVLSVMPDLEGLGYARDSIQAVMMAPPQPVDYSHFFCAPSKES